jgi:beta-lactam-binding protein with PASTA domain/predicted Ser/Thr protein kinase
VSDVTGQTGRVLGGRYELGEVLGYGGMAEVFLGRDVRLGRQVAVKVLRSDLARDPSFLARFRREAQAAASLSHPAIVSVFDTGEDEIDGARVPWIVMEHVEGRTLRDLLRQEGRLLPRRAVEIVSEVCSALAFAHRNGLVHRDIKPGNVMINRQGQVKVMDFGIARALSSASGALTQTAAVVGTAQYLSPEQARGEHVDARSDIYSTGCLLYELLTGRPPFQGDSPVSVAYQHVREDPIAPSRLDPEITADLDAVVLTAMAKDPVNRYQSGESFREDLERVATGRRVQATPVLPQAAVSSTAATTYLPAGDTTQTFSSGRNLEAERARRRRGYAAIAAACLLVLVLVALLVRSALSGGDGGTVKMPNLVGLTKDQAIQSLQAAGLKRGDITTKYENTDTNKGNVIDQSVLKDFSVNKGTEVAFTVSGGIEYVTVPPVVGFTQKDAEKSLTEAGFALGTPQQKADLTKEPGTVLAVTPAEGSKQPKGTRVVLTVVAGKSTIPDLTGLTREIAADRLQKAGFALGTVTTEPSDAKTGTVIRQAPAPGVADRGTAVSITLAEPKPSPTPSPTPVFSPSPVPTDTPAPTETPTATPTP